MPRAAGTPTSRSPLFRRGLIPSDPKRKRPAPSSRFRIARAFWFTPPYGELRRRRNRAGLRSSRCQFETLTSTPRPITGKRPRSHSEPRPKRRRHAMQWRAAVAADVKRLRLDAQPVTARGTLRIQALDGPAGQVLHPNSPRTTQNQQWACTTEKDTERKQPPRKTEGLCGEPSCVSSGIYTITSGGISESV